jgi:PAS domain-containing protein
MLRIFRRRVSRHFGPTRLSGSLEALWRYRLASVSRADGNYMEALPGIPAGERREPLTGSLSSLPSLLRFSTIGVALFDGNLQCRAFNGALRRMIGASLKGHTGKQLHQVFALGAPKLELAFRRVWTSGNSLSNFEITAELPTGTKPRRWVMNFYPITDEAGQVRLVATTFGEVTQGRRVELKLSVSEINFNLMSYSNPTISKRNFPMCRRGPSTL